MSGLDFRLATADDDPELRRLLRTNPMPGQIRVSFEREPDALAAGAVAGDRHHTIVAADPAHGRLIGMGSRTVYSGFVNGRRCRIGYLSQLRLERAYRGRIRLLARGYQLLHSLRARDELPFDITTIVADNCTARRVLGAGLPHLPAYRELEAFTTSIVPLWRRVRAPACPDVRIERGSPERLDGIAACLERNRSRLQFAPCWTPDELRSADRSRDLAPGDFLVALASGRIVGCAAVWNQSRFKQIVVHDYGPWMRRWQPWTDLLSRVAGTPRLPAPGQPLPHVFLSHVAVDGDRLDVFGALTAGACNQARRAGHACLIAGFAARHPFARALTGLSRAWTYSSLLYAVSWGADRADGPALDGRVPHLEVALL